MRARRSAVAAGLLAVGLAPALAGCGAVGAVKNLLSGPPRRFDAHVLLGEDTGCATRVARTLRHGYTVLTPEAGPAPYVALGAFEGPVQTGESVFRYVPPAEAHDWPESAGADVVVDVQAVELDLAEASAQARAACGGGTVSDPLPRRPAGQ